LFAKDGSGRMSYLVLDSIQRHAVSDIHPRRVDCYACRKSDLYSFAVKQNCVGEAALPCAVCSNADSCSRDWIVE
jgi:hypothetical protein